MPLNLTAEAQAAWERYLEANTLQEKIRALEEYISLIPKHKGAENEIRTAKMRLAKLKAQQAEEKAKKKGSGESWLVPKELDGQVSIIGPVNVGKSTLVNLLAGKEATAIGNYPFTTIKPEVGVLDLDGAQIQLVDLPAVIEGSHEGANQGTKVLTSVRNSDMVIIVLDLSQDPCYQLDLMMHELESFAIKVNSMPPPIKIEKTGSGSLQFYKPYNFQGDLEYAKQILRLRGYVNANIIFEGPVTTDDLEEALNHSVTRKRAIIVAMKGDLPGSAKNYQKLLQHIKEKDYPFDPEKDIIPTSSVKLKNLELIKQTIFENLNIIRVYTRNSAGKVAEKPLVLKKGENTVRHAVGKISKKFLKTFRFARVWGTSVKFSGEKVGLDHELHDKDQVQVYA